MKLEIFPLLFFSFIIYVVLTLVGPDNWQVNEVMTLPLYSGDPWTMQWGDLFLVASMGLLFIELVRATKTGSASITNHLLSFILFIIVLLCFILAPGFGNSNFFIYLTMTLLDPMAGFVVTTVTARRDFGVSDKGGLLG